MKRIISIFLTMMIMISTIGCRSKEDDPIEKKDTNKQFKLKNANKIFSEQGRSIHLEVEPVNQVFLQCIENISGKKYEADEDAEYDRVIEINLSELKPTVAFPHLPENTKTTDEITEDIKIDQVVIGSCTNGRIEDMRIAAEIMRGKKVADDVRCIVFPGTQAIYLEAIEKGYITDMVLAGAAISTPTCGPCLGGHMGILAAGERAVSTTNRNFVGRMGHTESEVYLASPAVAAASAITGKISSPSEVCGGEK